MTSSQHTPQQGSNWPAAEAWRRRGLRVFPIVTGTKRPHIEGYQEEASNDPEKVRGWWEKWPNANVGVVLGGGVHVIDIDVKNGAGGLQSFLDLGLFFDTLTVRTPSNGFHVYYSDADDFANTVGVVPGIDVRSRGGMALAPGSCFDGGFYTVECDLPIAPLPTALKARLRPPLDERKIQQFVPIDDERSIQEAIFYLQNSAKLAVSGMGGTTTAYAVAAALTHDYALSDETAFELMWTHWNERCMPPWGAHELDGPNGLRTIVSHGAQYGRGGIGTKTSQHLFGSIKPPPPVRETTRKRKSAIPLQKLSEVEMKPVSWLWPGRFAYEMVGIIAGPPGQAKSQLLAYMASVITTGGTWPTGETCDIGSVLVLQAEDVVAQTLKPRFVAAGADPDRVFSINSICVGEGETAKERLIALDEDLDEVDALLEENPDITTIMIDAIGSYLGNADSHKDAEVRAVLTPLAALAEKRGVAVVAIAHLNKGGSGKAVWERVLGAGAFVAVARLNHMVVQDPEDDTGGRRVFQPFKQNIGRSQKGLAFHVEGVKLLDPKHPEGIETSRVVWEGEATVDLQEALNPNRNKEGKTSRLEEAVQWLRNYLAAGPKTADEVHHDAKGNGISIGTLKNAKKELGIISEKKPGAFSDWTWRLPTDPRSREAFAGIKLPGVMQ